MFLQICAHVLENKKKQQKYCIGDFNYLILNLD